MSEKKQLHISGMNLLSRCGIAYQKRYQEGIRTPNSVAAAIGTAVDKSVTRNLGQKIADGNLLQAEEVQSIARDALVESWSEVEATEEDKEEGLDSSRDEAIDKSVDLAGFHHSRLAPILQPTHVQREWTLDIAGIDHQVAGTIDILEGHKAIRDTKTSGKSPMKTLADTSLQLTTYALAINAHDGSIPEKVVLDYLIRTPKRKEMKLIQLESTRTKADFPALLERIAAADRIIKAGSFTPAPSDSWWCSGKFCAYFGQCKFAVRPVSIAA
jgi:CRISPR/Cas system-associated exonuclease Cas4 (RecB family)